MVLFLLMKIRRNKLMDKKTRIMVDGFQPVDDVLASTTDDDLTVDLMMFSRGLSDLHKAMDYLAKNRDSGFTMGYSKFYQQIKIARSFLQEIDCEE